MRYASDGRTAASLPRYKAEVHSAQGWSIPAASKLQSRYCDAMQMIHGKKNLLDTTLLQVLICEMYDVDVRCPGTPRRLNHASEEKK